MPYVQRDGSGNITGVYANSQPGYAIEFIANTDPTLVAFLQRAAPPDPSAILQQALITKGTITQSDLTTATATLTAKSASVSS